jgi:carboxyl-terminal processing protease
MRLHEMTLAGLVALSLCLAGPRATLADGPSREQSKPSSAPPGLAKLVESVVETVMEHHIDPPARQQMILTGVKALFKTVGAPVPERLSQRVSTVTTPEQLASLLADIWPASTGKAATGPQLEEALLNGLLSNVSGNAYVMLEKERKVQEQSEGNRYVGIHIALGTDETEKRPKISEIIEGGPADRAGVKSNDLIEQIDGADTKGMALRDAVDRLRGDEGTSVTIKVRQVDQAAARTYTIVRGQHPRPTITGWHKGTTGDWDFRMSDFDPIAYLRINEMAGSTPHELRKIAVKLESQGIKAIVFDLRGRSRNSVHTAVLLADSLLDHGTIGRVRTGQGEMLYQADSDAILRGRPIAVLVDSGTSDAAEWLAAAIQDNKRGVVVGTPTMSARVDPGNAVVNSTFRIGTSEWSVSLTTGILERGDGRPLSSFDRSISTVMREPNSKTFGVHPDYPIAEDPLNRGVRFLPRRENAHSRNAQTGPDAAEQKAVEVLRRLLEII